MANAKGDDLERANHAFGRLSDKALDDQYGQSGKTVRQLWDTWKRGRAEWETANRELERLLSAT